MLPDDYVGDPFNKEIKFITKDIKDVDRECQGKKGNLIQFNNIQELTTINEMAINANQTKYLLWLEYHKGSKISGIVCRRFNCGAS